MSRMATTVTHEQQSSITEHRWPRLPLQCNEWDEGKKKKQPSASHETIFGHWHTCWSTKMSDRPPQLVRERN